MSSLCASLPHSACSVTTLELEIGHDGICTIEMDKHYKLELPWPEDPEVREFFPAHHGSLAS